jgi:hypothetical protein
LSNNNKKNIFCDVAWLAAIDGPQTHKSNQKLTTEMFRKNYWYGKPGAKGGVEFYAIF